jgi:transposase
MSPAFIKGVTEARPNARITLDKFHVIAHVNSAVDKTRRIEQRTEPVLKSMRWPLLKDAFELTPNAGFALYGLITAPRLTVTARAWVYK